MTERIAVVGLGLMGGSLLRGLAPSGRGAGWSPDPDEREAARAVPGARVPDGLAEALEGAAGVVLAVPLGAMRGLLARVAVSVPAAWISDVGSLQAPPLAWAREVGVPDRYVTSHPMTGGETSGFGASREDLYREARVWLSADRSCPPAVHARVERLWAGLGADPDDVGAEDHDRVMASVSHLPQVVSTHLAALLADEGRTAAELGPGGRDTTRLGGSDARMWQDILSLSGPALTGSLRELARRLDAEAARLEAGEVGPFGDLLARTRAWRDE